MKFSTFQDKIFDGASNTKNHMIINAVAGSGKTTTLVEIMNRISGKVIFLAFNKAIAEELKRRSPDYVECSTLHSAGYKILRNTYGSIKLDDNKIDNIMGTCEPLQTHGYMNYKEKGEVFELRKSIKDLVAKIKNSMAEYKDVDELQKIADHYSIDLDVYAHIKTINDVMNKSNAMLQVIDFNDMIYLPVKLNLSCSYPYDYVLVDESQDMNSVQIELVLKLCKQSTGRIFAVGDPKQSIYGFRGADSEAMNRIKTKLNAVEYPLSVCYRCPSSHLDLVKSIVPQIEARENAPVGIIENIKEVAFVEAITKETHPLILCRTNNYMIPLVLEMIGKGHKAIIKGRDIGLGLLTIVKKLKAKTTDELEVLLMEWKDKQITKLSKRDAMQSAIDAVQDKYDAICYIMEDCKFTEEVIEKITRIFSDDSNNSYVFSTIHRAKGLESDTVYILAPHMIPLHWKNQKPHELEQEYNISYVSKTRSKNKLVFVESPKKDR